LFLDPRRLRLIWTDALLLHTAMAQFAGPVPIAELCPRKLVSNFQLG
jgi:hypothetical protein